MASTKSIKQPSAFDINAKSMHQQTHFNDSKNIEWSQSVFFMHAGVHLQFLKDRNLWDCPTKELQTGKPSVLHTRELHNRVKILSVPKLCVIVNARTYTRTVKSSHRYTLAWRGNGKKWWTRNLVSASDFRGTDANQFAAWRAWEQAAKIPEYPWIIEDYQKGILNIW